MELLLLADGKDPAAQRLLASLRGAGCEVRVVERAREAEHALRARPPHALLFDPDAADRDFLARVRRQDPSQTLVAWIPGSSSARVAELLDSGADEVVDGAMGQPELLARIRAAVRRGGRFTAAAIEVGPLRIDAAHGEASWEGRELFLTRREREVLEALAESAGRTVRREILYRRVWGYAMARGDRSVDVNVKRLRAKLVAAAVGTALAIKTHPGVGYRLELAAPVEAESPPSVTAL